MERLNCFFTSHVTGVHTSSVEPLLPQNTKLRQNFFEKFWRFFLGALPQSQAICGNSRVARLPYSHFPAVKVDGARIASLIPCRNFLSAGAIVASAPRNFTRSSSMK